MFDMEVFKKLYSTVIDKKVWVIMAERTMSKNGRITVHPSKLTVYPGTITDIIIGTNIYFSRAYYASTEVEALLECPMMIDGEMKTRWINSGRLLLNVNCFDSETEAREELERMTGRTQEEQTMYNISQMGVRE